MSEEKKKRVLDENSKAYEFLCKVADYKDEIGPNPTDEQRELLELKTAAVSLYLGFEGMMANSGKEALEITAPVRRAFSRVFGDRKADK